MEGRMNGRIHFGDEMFLVSIFVFFFFFPKKKIKKIVCNHTAKYVVTDQVWSLGCHNSVPHTGWFRQQKFIFSHFWRSEIQDQGARKFSFW